MTPEQPNPFDARGHLPAPVAAAPGITGNGADSMTMAGRSGGFYAEDGPRGPGLKRYVAALFRYKWLMLAILVVGTGLGFFAARFTELAYVVQATLWMEPGAGRNQGPIQQGKLLDQASWTDLLKSFAVLDHVVQSERLYLQTAPENSRVFNGFELKEKFVPGEYRMKIASNRRQLSLELKSGQLIGNTPAGDSVGAKLGFKWIPTPSALQPGTVVDFAVRRPRDVARALSSQLQTRMQKNGSFLMLELRGGDPIQLASTLNAVANRFVDVAAELKRAQLEEFAEILAEQLRHAEQNLQSAELQLEAFRINTITLPTEAATPVAPGLSETRNPVMTSFVNLKVEQDMIRRDRAAVDAAIAGARDSALSIAQLEVIPGVQTSTELKTALNDLSGKRAEIRVLQYRYTDEFADIKRLRGEVRILEREIIPAAVAALRRELDRRDQQIEGLIGSASGELRQIPPRVMEEARLGRQVAIAGTIYQTLRSRNEEAQLAAMSSSPDLRILDKAAVPDRPIEDTRNQLILLAVLGSLGLAVVAALALDQFDPRVRYPEQVTHGLRLPILSVIPSLTNGNGRPPRDLENTTQALEAFRELRMRLLQTGQRDGRLISTVTSPGSGDGKSFVAVNLAMCFAEQGYRTLLIDGDIRRGDLHHLLGTTRQPGLTDLLASRAQRFEATQATAYPRLDFIASGKRMENGPELLGSQALADLLSEAQSQYSIVLIDSPPLGAGIDPFMLAAATGNVLVVLRAGRTDRQFAEAKLVGLDGMPVIVLGAVFNGAPVGGPYRYYSYLSGYESPDEETFGEKGRLPAAPARSY